MSAELAGNRWELLFNTRRSRRYHEWRVKFFRRFVTVRLTLTFIFSSAAFITILSASGIGGWVISCAGVAALLNALEYAVQFSAKADLHRALLGSFVELERDIVAKGGRLTQKQLDAFQARYIEIEMDEPPVLKSLNRLCYNEEVRARFPEGEWKKHTKKVSFWQRILASFLDLNLHSNVRDKERRRLVPTGH